MSWKKIWSKKAKENTDDLHILAGFENEDVTASEHLRYALSYFKNPKNIFEFGCGPGRLAREIVNMGIEYTGVDNNKDLLKRHKELVPESNLLCIDYHKDYKFEYPDNFFDYVFSWGVLLYLPIELHKPLIDELLRISKQGLLLGDLQNLLPPKGYNALIKGYKYDIETPEHTLLSKEKLKIWFPEAIVEEKFNTRKGYRYNAVILK